MKQGEPSRLRWRDVFLVAAALGLATGLAETALLALARFGLDRFTHLNPQSAWLAPISYLLLFLLLTALLRVLAWRVSPDRMLRWVLLVCMALGGAGVLFLYQRLSKLAALLVAAGIATQLSLMLARRAGRFVPLARRAVPVLALLVTAVFAGLNGRWLLEERRALAALPAPPAGAPNVLLIIWDTVRAASLSLYGYERPTSPNLQRLAESGVAFDHAYSTAPWTLPSHASVFTGLLAPELSADWRTPLDARPRTLAEVLRDRGWRTGGFAANTYNTSRETGLARGFTHYADYFVFSAGDLLRSSSLMRAIVNRPRWRHALHMDDLPGRKRAPDVDAEFLRWAGRDNGHPFFAFLNYFDAHDPYLPPSPWDTLFGPRLPGRDPVLRQVRKLSPREVVAERDAYDGSIAYLDQHLGMLLDSLRQRGMLDNTIVIVTADHGEEFGEHGVFTHGNSLYDRVLHVPLVISWPRSVPRGARVDAWISLRDVAATVLDVLGVPSDSLLPGRSLARWWIAPPGLATRPDTLIAAVSYASGNPTNYPVSHGDMRATFADPLKLIRDGDGAFELYDLRQDPDERHDLSTTADSVRALLAKPLERFPGRIRPARH